MENIDADLFGVGNLTGADVNPNSVHGVASRVRKKHNTIYYANTQYYGIISDVLRMQSQLEEDNRLNDSKNSREVFRYIHYPLISRSGIQIKLTDEALIRLYHSRSLLTIIFRCNRNCHSGNTMAEKQK